MKLGEIVKAEGAITALLEAQVDDGKLALKMRKIASPYRAALTEYHELLNAKINELSGGQGQIRGDDPNMAKFIAYMDDVSADESFNPSPLILEEADVEKIKVPRAGGAASALTAAEIDDLVRVGIIREAP